MLYFKTDLPSLIEQSGGRISRKIADDAAGRNWLYALVMLIHHIDVSREDRKFVKFVLIEEVENGLHPDFQKLIPVVLSKFSELQFIISTHSPFIINSALELDDQNVYHIQDGICLNPTGYNKQTNEITTAASLIHKTLGMLPSDLFFSNCLVWVEGPTDAIYINFWLKKYMVENRLPSLKKGIDYEFALLGGASAENFYLLPDDYKFTYNNDSKIFHMLKIHPNSFVVVDNDGGTLEKGIEMRTSGKTKNVGASGFECFKQKVIDEFSETNYWYDTNPDNFTIECYRKGIVICTDEMGKKYFKSDTVFQTKKNFALKYCKKNEASKFSDIVNDGCKEMIKKLYNKILHT